MLVDDEDSEALGVGSALCHVFATRPYVLYNHSKNLPLVHVGPDDITSVKQYVIYPKFPLLYIYITQTRPDVECSVLFAKPGYGQPSRRARFLLSMLPWLFTRALVLL